LTRETVSTESQRMSHKIKVEKNWQFLFQGFIKSGVKHIHSGYLTTRPFTLFIPQEIERSISIITHKKQFNENDAKKIPS